MKVSLISHTQDALDLLLFTKQTRLKMSAGLIDEVKAWPEEKKQSELAYMLNTIKSSFEFVDYVFMIEGVTRAFTHQLVRHRVGTAFAQQAQRVIDASGFDYMEPDAVCDCSNEQAHITYRNAMDQINESYGKLIDLGVNPQDARGVLPTNICTNIVFKANLRTLSGMCAERLCVRAQGEFQNVMRAIRDAVLEVHPWADKLLRVHCAQTSTCCFNNPNTKCPIKPFTLDPDGEDNRFRKTRQQIHEWWLTHRAEPQPKGVQE